MKQGDLLLCTWNNGSVNKIFGWLVRLFTKSNYVHVAIASDNYGNIIEANTTGVEETKNYWENYDIYRVKKASEEQLQRVIDFCRKEKGSWYDYGALIYLAWLYITFQRKRINEWNSKNRWFCSELVCAAYKDAGLVLCPGIPDANVSPEDVAESPLIYEVK